MGERWVLFWNRVFGLGETLDAPLAAHAHQFVGQTPLLLGIEACMGRRGGNIFTQPIYAFRPSGATKIGDHYYTEWFGLFDEITIARNERRDTSEIDHVEEHANHLKVPVAYASTLYTLQNHIDLVREGLKEHTDPS